MSFRDVYLTKLPDFEGQVPHLYLDSKGFVTVAIGKMLPNVSASLLLPWRTQSGRPATDEEIKADFARVKAMPRNLLYRRYFTQTSLILPKREIFELLEQCVDDVISRLSFTLPVFRGAPDEAKLGMLDMDFNMGTVRRKDLFPDYSAAIAAADWRGAARYCHRAAPVSEDRNTWTRLQFEAASRPHVEDSIEVFG